MSNGSTAWCSSDAGHRRRAEDRAKSAAAGVLQVKKTASSIAVAATIAVSICVSSSLAGDFAAGSRGSGEKARALPGAAFSLHDFKPAETPKIAVEETPRALPTDEASVIKGLTARGMSADGKDLTVEPSEAMRDIVGKALSGGSPGTGGKAISLKSAGAEGARTVFGEDDRVEITDTEDYPYRMIGLILMESKAGEKRMCSGTLIGPHTVLTAAHCIYDHDRGGWLQNFRFVPGSRGSNTDDAPFGVYAFDAVYILDGYTANYEGTYNSVFLWDLGIITLQDPIGDDLGWMAYNHFEDLGAFETNITGYPGDKPFGTMWLSTCETEEENIAEVYFVNDCDAYPGSSGSAEYAIDDDGNPVIVGVFIAENPKVNTGLRLNAAYFEWVNNLNQ